MQGWHWLAALLLALALSASVAADPVRVQSTDNELGTAFSAMLASEGVVIASADTDVAVTVAIGALDDLPPGALLRVGVPYRSLLAGNAGCPCAGISIDPHPADQLNLLHRLLPQVLRVGVIIHRDNAWQEDLLAPVAKRLGLALKVAYVDSGEALPEALADLLPRVGALMLLPDERLFNSTTARHLLLTSFRQRRPVIGPDAGFVRAGALASVYPSLEGYARMTAQLLPALPEQQAQAHFPFPAVQVNPHVARNFGILIGDLDELPQQLEASR